MSIHSNVGLNCFVTEEEQAEVTDVRGDAGRTSNWVEVPSPPSTPTPTPAPCLQAIRSQQEKSNSHEKWLSIFAFARLFVWLENDEAFIRRGIDLRAAEDGFSALELQSASFDTDRFICMIRSALCWGQPLCGWVSGWEDGSWIQVSWHK